MTLSFRNVDVDVDAPLEAWPYEALIMLIERGTLHDWVRITRAVDDDPWGPVARQVEEYLSYEHPYGVAPSLPEPSPGPVRKPRAGSARRSRARSPSSSTSQACPWPTSRPGWGHPVLGCRPTGPGR